MTPHPDSADDANGPSESALTRRRLLGVTATAGAASLAGCANSFVRVETAETTVEHRFDADDVARLRVVDATDDVSVERFDGDAVRVRVHKRARGETKLSELEFRSRVADDALQLRTRKPNVAGIGGGSVDLEIAVPASVVVERVECDDDVALRNVTGDLVVESDDGDVAVHGVEGDVSATTDDGDVAVENVGGVVTARSGDGDVAVRDPGAVREISSNDGDVTAAIPAVDGTATVRSGDGDVTVSLGDALDATVEITTADGQITVAGGFDRLETTTEHRVTGVVGDGTNELGIRSDDGDVTVARL